MKWTKEEEVALRNEFLKGKTVEELAHVLKREPGAIRARLRKLAVEVLVNYNQLNDQ